MTLLDAIKKHNEGIIALHKANIAVYLKNPVVLVSILISQKVEAN